MRIGRHDHCASLVRDPERGMARLVQAEIAEAVVDQADLPTVALQAGAVQCQPAGGGSPANTAPLAAPAAPASKSRREMPFVSDDSIGGALISPTAPAPPRIR